MPIIETKQIKHTGFHLPGHNYMGPGTNVVERIEAGETPIDKDDRTAKDHDIACIGATNAAELLIADLDAFDSFTYSTHGIIGKVGMLARIYTGNEHLFLGNDPKLAEKLKHITERW